MDVRRIGGSTLSTSRALVPVSRIVPEGDAPAQRPAARAHLSRALTVPTTPGAAFGQADRAFSAVQAYRERAEMAVELKGLLLHRVV